MPVRFRSAARWAVLLIALVAVRADAQTTSTRAGLAELITEALDASAFNDAYWGA